MDKLYNRNNGGLEVKGQMDQSVDFNLVTFT